MSLHQIISRRSKLFWKGVALHGKVPESGKMLWIAWGVTLTFLARHWLSDLFSLGYDMICSLKLKL
jgi:hypothetical protein